MLVRFFACPFSWSERQNMSKEAAAAAVSTKCDFANGAAERKDAAGSGESRSKHGVRFCEWRGEMKADYIRR